MLTLLTLVALLALAVLTLVAYVQTGAGEARLRTRVLSAVNGAIAGRLEVGRLNLEPGGLVIVDDLRVYDPDDQLVIALAHAEIEIDVAKLVDKHVQVRRATLRGGEVLLLSSPEGLNLARAFQPRNAPRGPKPPSGPFAWDIEVDLLRLDEVHVRYAEVGKEVPAFELTHGALAAAARYGKRGTHLSLGVAGEVAQPTKEAFFLKAQLDGGASGDPNDQLKLAPLTVIFGHSRARLAATRDGKALGLTVEELFVAKEDVAALAPTAPLLTDLSATGTLRYDGQSASAHLALPLDEANVKIDADADLSGPAARVTGTVAFAHVDLARVVDRAPPTDLNGRATIDLTQGTPKPGSGTLDLTLDRSTLNRGAVRTLHAAAAFAGLDARVTTLTASAAGGDVTVSGEVSPQSLALDVAVKVRDAGAFAANAAAFGNAEAPPLGGSGTVKGTVRGPPRHLAIDADAALEHFYAPNVDLTGVTVEATLPDLANPYVVKGRGRAKRAVFGELVFDALSADVDANGRAFIADVTGSGFVGARVHVAGTLDQGQTGASFEALEVALGDDRWAMERPAHLVWTNGVRVDRLSLVSGEQRLALEGGLTKQTLDARLDASGVLLEALPSALVKKELALAGRVDADLHATGTVKKPAVEGTVAAKGLGVQRYRDIDLEVTARVDRERVKGAVKASRHEASLVGEVDAPLLAFKAPDGTPISAGLSVEHVDLADLAATLEVPELTGGEAELTATLRGTTDAPELSAVVTARKVVYGVWPSAELTVKLESGEKTDVTGTLSVRAGDAVLHVASPLALGPTLRKPPDKQAALAIPFDATVKVERLDLKNLSGVAGIPEGTNGVLALDAHVTGSAAHPRATATGALSDATWGKHTGLTVDARLDATDDAVRLRALATKRGRRALQAEVAYAVPPERLFAKDAFATLPLTVRADGGPIDLVTLLVPDEPTVNGILTLSLALDGTLEKPRVGGTLTLADLTAENKPLGSSVTTLKYADAKATSATTVKLEAGGGAALNVEAGLDLGYRALRTGLDWKKAPLAASLRADALNLAILNAIPGPVRRASGTLSANANLSGTLGAPVPRGHVEVQDARLSITGSGTYREVALVLDVTDTRVALQKLHARSGDGTADVKLFADRSGPGTPYVVDAGFVLDKFPLMLNDQLVAKLSGRPESFTGQLEGMKMAFDLRLKELTVELPEVAAKNLQPLEQNPDFIIVRSRRRGVTGEEPAAETAPKVSPLDVLVHVAAARNVWVVSTDLKVEAGLDVRVAYREGKTEVSGEIDTRRGRVDALSRHFEVQRGKITFTGGAPNNPRLDIVALHENTRENVKVKVAVSGSAQKPKIELSSEPPLDESQIATLLATGRRELKRGSGGVTSGGGASSVLGAYAADKVRKIVASKLPVDVLLNVDVGSEGLGATLVEAGTYLTDKIYVGYRKSFGAQTERGENANEVRVEYQVSPHVTVESQYGDAGKGGGDIMWTNDY